MRILSALFLFVPVLSCSLDAQVVYNKFVSLGGSDANDGTKAKPWRTISHAVSTSLTGTAIHIGPGTYGTPGFLEGIEVTGGKGLVLRGAGRGKTIIRAHAGFSRSVPVAGGTQTWTAPIIVWSHPSNLAVYDLTIDSANLSAARVANAVYTDGGQGKMIRTELRGAGAVATNSAQDHVGLVAVGRSGTRSKVRISSSFVHGFNKSGIRMFGSGLTGVIEFCTVRGAGRVDGFAVAQEAIQLGPGGWDYTVNNTSVRDVWHESSTKSALGIRVLNTFVPARIVDNKIVSCEIGVSHDGSSSAKIEENNVANCDVAVRVLSNGASATANDFDANTSLEVANGVTFPVTKNSYSDLRRNFGYPTKYVVSNNLVIKDLSPNLGSRGFKAPVDLQQNNGDRPHSIATGDFNGDGILDFAVANLGGNEVVVHFGSGGSDFATKSAREIRVSGGPLYLVAGEFNGKSGLDLICVTAAGKAHLLRNKGTSYFDNPSTLSFPSLGTPSSIAAGDLDGKDQTDVVIGFAGTSTANGGVVVLHPKAGALTVGAAVPGAYRKVTAVGISKLDQGAKNDLFVVDASNGLGTSDKLHVLLDAAIAGTFNSPTSVPIGVKGHGADAGDLDGDGDADIVVTTSGDPGTVHVFHNNGLGVLSQPATSPLTIAADAQAVKIVDLQSDSDFDTTRMDVVVCHPGQHKITQLFGYLAGDFRSYRGTFTRLAPMGVAFGHTDNDGVLDMFTANLGDDSASIHLSTPDALAQVIGVGCPGTSSFEGTIPRISPKEQISPNPRVGNSTFGIAVRNARPMADAILILTIREKLAPQQCGLLVGRLFYWQVLRTDGDGEGSIPLAVPNDPTIAGVDFYGQYIVVDPQGQLAGNFAMSSGMRFRIGN